MEYRFVKVGAQCAVFVSLAAAACFAGAQSLGQYSGTTDDGNQVFLDVADDGAGGMYIDGLSAGFSMTCADNSQSGWGIGWGGSLAEITNGKASAALLSTIASTTFKVSFQGASSAKGTIAGSAAQLVTAKKAQLCSSAKQGFTLTHDDGAQARPAAGTKMLSIKLDPAGHVISEKISIAP